MNMPPFFRGALPAIAAVLLVAAPASAADGQVVVKFAPGKARTSAMPSGARLGNTIHALGARVVRTTGDPAAAAAALNRRADVEYAEVDRPMQLFATPNDPRFRELYGLNNTGQTGGVADADIDAPEGWDVAGIGAFPQTGGVKVGIVDTGITQTHEDLAGKIADCAKSQRPDRHPAARSEGPAPTTTATAPTSPARSPRTPTTASGVDRRRVQLAAGDLQGARAGRSARGRRPTSPTASPGWPTRARR